MKLGCFLAGSYNQEPRYSQWLQHAIAADVLFVNYSLDLSILLPMKTAETLHRESTWETMQEN